MNIFTFQRGVSALHRLDVRYKTALVCMVSLALLKAGFAGCFICFLVLAWLTHRIGISFIPLAAQLKWFILLLGIMCASRSLTVPGTPVFTFFGFAFTHEGLAQGGLVAIRFFLVMVTGLLFSATTRPADLKGAAQWYLKPVPFVPEKRVAIIISLFLRFLPLILTQAQQVSDAVNARCGNLNKNPVRRIRYLVLPLIKKIFLAGDRLCLAMEARCYSEDRTDPVFEAGGNEKRFLAAGLYLCLVMVCPFDMLLKMTFWS